ncbi:ATP-dependent nuclease [Lysinibacillus sp. NPDC093190]|uniref:ATP-dependent nuclease n=1 Tax=Lysinibacillus sp. NPDC093190 TaxID=3390575 RepID=UPI003D02778A
MKLAEIEIENFKGIAEPIKIKIDNIVALLGNNNVGKTTILSAYEAFADSTTVLTEKDFFNEDTTNLPTIKGVFINVPEGIGIGKEWIHNDPDSGYENCIKVKFVWEEVGKKRVKYSYSPSEGDFIAKSIGGFESILMSKIPHPIKISPLEDPLSLQTKILAIINETIKANIADDHEEIQQLIEVVEALTDKIKGNISEEISTTTTKIADQLKKVFPEYNNVQIDINPGNLEAEKLVSAGSVIRLGKADESGEVIQNLPLSQHGTGLQRTFLWSALKMLAETGKYKKGKVFVQSEIPKILLIEEPEAFLHPSAIREAREALYSIADIEGWQVMTTTHSPLFIDLTKDHTTIIRIEKETSGNRTVKTFSTDSVSFSDEEKENLKMLNYCNPNFNELFFAKTNLLVEGETEFSVIKLLQQELNEFKDIHILNCIGKANIVTVSKILNHFKVPYKILHDADNPTVMKTISGTSTKVKNGAWTNNYKIIEEAKKGIDKGIDIKMFASVPNFEGEFLKTEGKKSKPYEAWKFFNTEMKTGTNAEVKKFVKFLFYAYGDPAVTDCELEYSSIGELEEKVLGYINTNGLIGNEYWDLDHYNGTAVAVK